MINSIEKKDYKVTFVQVTGSLPYIGIMSLSAVLKAHGFSTDVFCVDIEKEDIVDNILKTKPDVVACSVMTTEMKRMMPVITAIKKSNPEVYIIMGGIHPTSYPHVMEQYMEDLDAICIGEGEYALLELVCSLSEGRLGTNIKNLWIKKNGKIIKNEVRDLIKDLDSLPFPDRDLYFEKYPLMAKGTIRFMMSRGCPHKCSYCFNKGMREMYNGKGSWLRFNSAERAIKEIKDVQGKWPIKWISFHDDTLNANKKRLKEFFTMYKKEINIPFICQLEVSLADEEQIEILKQAGVDKISVGIEHGDEEYRRRVLYRKVTNKKILEFGKWINKRGIRLHTQNILGFPDETVDMAFSGIELNAKIKPELAAAHILNPYPGTDIYEYAKNLGTIATSVDLSSISEHSPEYETATRARSLINSKNMKQLINLRCFFMLLVWYPWLKPVVKILIKFPRNRLYEFIWESTGTFRVVWKYADRNEKKVLLKRLLLRLFFSK